MVEINITKFTSQTTKLFCLIYQRFQMFACKRTLVSEPSLLNNVGISSLVLKPTVMIFCCCLLPVMVYKTYYNFVKSMLRSIKFPFQQIQIHPNPSPNVSILLVDVPKNRWRSSLIIRSCPGSVRLTILVISFMNQVQQM